MPTRDEVGQDVLAKRVDERRHVLMLCRGRRFFDVAQRDCMRNAEDGLILLPRQRRRNTADNSVGMMDRIIVLVYPKPKVAFDDASTKT